MKHLSVKSSPEWSLDQSVRHAGHLAGLDSIINAAMAGDIDDLAQKLTAERECFGIIIETPTSIIAATDRVRGHPIYLRQSDDGVEVVTDTSNWITPASKSDFNEERARTFLASGYSLGADTLFDSVRRLLPGEIVVIDRATGDITYKRYYFFLPEFYDKPDSNLGPEYWEGRVETALDNAIKRVIERANGATIWIPLSAGFDSRAIMAKLLSFGCKRLETFSYGTPGNMEARVAKELAEKAGVPWRFISSEPRHPREEFGSDEVNRYFMFAGGLGTTPAMSEFFAVRTLKQSGAFGDDDYMINGQSGDFLTGGHFPQPTTFADIALYCLNRHFALFSGEKSNIGPEGMEEILKDWMERYLPDNRKAIDTPEQLVSLYHSFEWQERQSQYVVQQQRAYDFLGIKWALPLWDAELMDLFEEVPFHEQIDQALYIRYLSKWNFMGLFDEGRRPYDPWPKYGMLYRTIARVIGLVAGAKAKANAYRKLSYWGDLHFNWMLFGRKTFTDFLAELRNPTSLFTLSYLARLRQEMGLSPNTSLEKKYATSQNVTGSK